mmetsp:Transcript_2198/g.7820  ORF Transcript_2198/g.7820 Transcript_2198/m.7820 type:complete len:227 (+) Transcript_2198:1814-2494(+)
MGAVCAAAAHHGHLGSNDARRYRRKVRLCDIPQQCRGHRSHPSCSRGDVPVSICKVEVECELEATAPSAHAGGRNHRRGDHDRGRPGGRWAGPRALGSGDRYSAQANRYGGAGASVTHDRLGGRPGHGEGVSRGHKRRRDGVGGWGHDGCENGSESICHHWPACVRAGLPRVLAHPAARIGQRDAERHHPARVVLRHCVRHGVRSPGPGHRGVPGARGGKEPRTGD